MHMFGHVLQSCMTAFLVADVMWLLYLPELTQLVGSTLGLKPVQEAAVAQVEFLLCSDLDQVFNL